jgi:hypothetical protein
MGEKQIESCNLAVNVQNRTWCKKLTECVPAMANLWIMGPNYYLQIAFGWEGSFCWKEHQVGLWF